MALADGEISEKERGIIFRKADALGEDKDEVEMILEGKLAMMKKQTKPDVEKAGNVIKCPQCKADVPSFSTVCEFCGHEFRNIERSKSVRDLLDELLAIDKSKTMFKDGGFFDTSAKANNLKMDEEAANRKVQVIHLFPVPNSKEDILEFLSVGIPMAKKSKNKVKKFLKWIDGPDSPDGIEQKINEAWASKCEQVIMKARFSMKNDQRTLNEINFYATELGIK